ncbi:unnamed protein product [Candidula unifasciata]|uniref:Mitochondrial fission process protein 1 n=1 Tax=Candidula unifasciata TaxID=100452 RepID=A0A8S3YLF8_9EUPU|nr:unnamed protein product [Candidula unifasciata]
MSDDNYSKYPWRLCGLGFAIAEALKYSYGRGVTNACSTVASTYIILRALKRGIRNERAFMAAAADSLIFDAFASVIIPSFITYHVCRITYRSFYEKGVEPGNIIWEPTIAGLVALCFTVDKVDNLVNDVMDKTLRESSDN